MSRKTHPPKNNRSKPTYITFEHIKQGGIPSQLYKKKYGKILKEYQVKHSLKLLLDCGYIEKIGKAVWETRVDNLPKDRSKFKTSHTRGVTKRHTLQIGRKPDSVRLHGMRILIKLPRYMEGWNNRAEILKTLKIDYVPIVQGQSISFEQIDKIWLTDKSIYIYFSTKDMKRKSEPPFSWYADDADDAKLLATNYILKFIGRLERHLHANFSLGRKYRMRFTNRHYGLIKNAIARKYNEEKKRFFGFDDTGCWVTIDNSFNFLELEAIHPDTSHDDNKILQCGLNNWKKGLTPDVLANTINKTQTQLDQTVSTLKGAVENQEYYGKHWVTHIDVLKGLKTEVGGLSGIMDGFKNAIKLLESQISAMLLPDKKKPVPVKIIEDTGEFTGFLPNGEIHTFDLKKGAVISLERRTANVVIINRKGMLI